MSDMTGKTFGPYTAIERLGEGGMADVYKGYQQSLNRYVAIKILKGELAQDQEFITRFRREALAVAKLSHPNILHVYDAGMANGVYYIAMDYAEGGTLKEQMLRGPLPTDKAASIAAQLCDALDYAHRQGIVHRDVKPTNVLLSRDGRPLLTDFGIAKALDEGTHLTRTGTSIGTPEYMAPEQAQGQAIDGRTDIYAMGIVLYEMLTGMVPFSAPTPMAALYRQINEPPPPLRQMNINVPEWLEATANKALAKRPEDRYQRAGEFATDLREHRAPAGVKVSTPPPAAAAAVAAASAAPARPRERRKRSPLVPVLLGTIVLLLVVVVGGGAFLLLGGGRQEQNTETPSTVVVVVAGTEDQGDAPTAAPTTAPEEPTEAPKETAAATAPEATALPDDTATEPPEPTTGPTLAPTSPPAATAEPTEAVVVPTNTPKPTQAGPTQEPGVISDFESFGTWTRGDEANGTFTQSNAQAHQGSYSGKLGYNFSTSGNDYVVFKQTHTIGGQPTRISAWVYADGSGHFLNIWIKENGGQVWQVPLGRIAHTGWQQMDGGIDAGQDWPWAHIEGPNNGKVDYPVSFIALVLDDKADQNQSSGTIYIDDLRADTGTASGGSSSSGSSGTTSGATSTPKPTSPPAAGLSVSGRIAYSVGGTLHVVNAKTGQDTIGPVANMRQPDFRSDGQVIIVNGQGGGQDSLWSVIANAGLEREQSTHPDDHRPFFSQANPGRYVYDSTMMGKGEFNLVTGNLGDKRKAQNERQPLTFGGGFIIGNHPVWLSNDTLVYSGCDYGFGSGSTCGLFVVPSWGGMPERTVPGSPSDIPSDASGTKVLFSSQRDGNWEVYFVNADGSGLRNLSKSNSSDDGLGTFSPDGKAVAFVSNRGGGWAVWAVPAGGGSATKLFSLPGAPSSGIAEGRISWGP